MPSIVSYQKYIDTLITRELRLPEDPVSLSPIGTELATIDNVTYVTLPDGVVLPKEQPAEITGSIKAGIVTDDLRAALRAASPHTRLIDERVQAAISERYSNEEEARLMRTAPTPEFITAYNAYAGECRAWGRAEKAKLGL